MIYWLITFKDGTTGYQVMDDTLNNAAVVDADGNPISGSVEYVTTDTETPTPVWANA